MTYIGIYTRFGGSYKDESSDPKELLESFELSEDYGEIFAVVIFNKETKDVFWYQDFIGLDECKKRIDDYFANPSNYI